MVDIAGITFVKVLPDCFPATMPALRDARNADEKMASRSTNYHEIILENKNALVFIMKIITNTPTGKGFLLRATDICSLSRAKSLLLPGRGSCYE